MRNGKPIRSNWAVAACAAVLVLSLMSLAAGRSDVSDAAMRGDAAAVRTLVAQKADVNATQPDGATALHWAVHHGNRELVDLLVRAGANVKAANRIGVTPLSMASLAGNAAIIDLLLKGGANVNERGPNGETPLMMAARNGNPDAIKVLLDRGADINAKDPLRETAALMWAVEQEHPAAVKILIERGADVTARSKVDAGRGGRGFAAGANAAGRGGGGARGGGQGGAQSAANNPPVAAAAQDDDQNNDTGAGGGLTPLVFAARQGDIESAKLLLAAKADMNQTSAGGWTPLLTATKNGFYKLGKYLLEQGADPNIANAGGWTPLYAATDNRNVDGGDYPTRKPDMNDLDYIKLLLARGANVNTRASASRERRTTFTGQWWSDDGATPFVRAAYSGDLTLMRLLLEHGADPKIVTRKNVTAVAVASGVGWVEGITHEWSAQESYEAVKLLLDLGVDVNAVDEDGRTALHGAAHKGRNDVVQLLADRGAKLDALDGGSLEGRRQGILFGRRWLPLDYAEGITRVGVQSAIPHPETAALLRKLMTERGIEVPPPGRNSTYSICLVKVC